jgi:hypothetical protein
MDGRYDLLFVADDSRVIGKADDIFGGVRGHFGYVETMECFFEVGPSVSH